MAEKYRSSEPIGQGAYHVDTQMTGAVVYGSLLAGHFHIQNGGPIIYSQMGCFNDESYEADYEYTTSETTIASIYIDYPDSVEYVHCEVAYHIAGPNQGATITHKLYSDDGAAVSASVSDTVDPDLARIETGLANDSYPYPELRGYPYTTYFRPKPDLTIFRSRVSLDVSSQAGTAGVLLYLTMDNDVNQTYYRIFHVTMWMEMTSG